MHIQWSHDTMSGLVMWPMHSRWLGVAFQIFNTSAASACSRLIYNLDRNFLRHVHTLYVFTSRRSLFVQNLKGVLFNRWPGLAGLKLSVKKKIIHSHRTRWHEKEHSNFKVRSNRPKVERISTLMQCKR